jgi:hypothetical protein
MGKVKPFKSERSGGRGFTTVSGCIHRALENGYALVPKWWNDVFSDSYNYTIRNALYIIL